MHSEVMNVDRRTFLGRAGLAGAALAIGGGVACGAPGAGGTKELADLRQRVAGYAGSVTVRRDSGAELDVVCEITDLDRFACDLAGVVPAGATARVAGNVLSFEHRGRQVRLENVLRT